MGDALSLFPGCVKNKGGDARVKMKKLKEIMFTFVAVVGLALAVSAQRDDKKDKPPKNPPTVDPGNKTKPRENPPREDKKPKKPGMAFVLVVERHHADIA